MSRISINSGKALLLLAVLAIIGYILVRLPFTDCDLILDAASDSKVNDKFRNQRIWITGASSGIGRAFAKRMATIEGTQLLLSARGEEKLHETCREISSSGGHCKVLPLDLADLPSLSEKVIQAKALMGGDIDILVNNGGMTMRARGKDATQETDMKIIKVDFISATILAKELVRGWLSRDRNHQKGIINVSGLPAKTGLPFRTSYSAAKAALNIYMESFRSEIPVEENISITNYCSGSTVSNASANALLANGELYGKTVVQSAIPVERTAQLIARAYANDLPEVWPFSNSKEKMVVYVAQYLPVLSPILARKLHEMMTKLYAI